MKSLIFDFHVIQLYTLHTLPLDVDISIFPNSHNQKLITEELKLLALLKEPNNAQDPEQHNRIASKFFELEQYLSDAYRNGQSL